MSVDIGRRLAPVVRLAPAKLNLTLAVVGRRTDGYHALHSLMVPLALADRLSLAAAADGGDTLHVAGPDTGPIEENLVLHAIRLAREAARLDPASGGSLPTALAVRLEKRIPVAAGLAGGSSDAAAALDGALEAWAIDLPGEVRAALAARIGSDVPFFLAGGAALVEGRGERVTPIPAFRGEPPGVLLVTPRIAVSTADVFAAYAAGIGAGDRGTARATSEHLAAEAARGLSSATLLARASVVAAANDLLPATLALVPALVPFRRALVRLLGRPVGQSGSGPTCFVLYPSLEEARRAADAVGAALAEGTLPPVAAGHAGADDGARAAPATVVATTIRTGSPDPGGTGAEEAPG